MQTIIRSLIVGTCLAGLSAGAEAAPQRGDTRALRALVAAQKARIDAQDQLLAQQQRRLDRLEALVRTQAQPSDGPAPQALAQQTTRPSGGAVPLPVSPPPPAGLSGDEVATVGVAPGDQRQVQVASLAEQGGIITRAGRLTLEGNLDYARNDRNSTVFRGIQIPQSVLIGVFDINQSSQDILTLGLTARLGLTNRFEINTTVPFIYRSDKSVLAPVADPGSPNAGQIDRAVRNGGVGDVSFGARYQVTDGGGAFPYLIAGVQAVVPTGSNPFKVDRDALGNALQAATGAGFWGVTPTLTAIMPSDPAVLFGTVGYTFNFGRSIGRQIGPAFIDYVRPGGEPTATLGAALSVNPRLSFSFGYAHTWAMGTFTRLGMTDPQTGVLGPLQDVRTRDLQLGRILFGVSYRTSPRTTINWNVEVGATSDATALRTSLRVPFTLGR